MWWLPWRRSRRQACWHDLVIPDDTRSGEMAEAVRAEIEHIAEIMNEPTVMYRGLRVPPWLVFTTPDDEW